MLGYGSIANGAISDPLAGLTTEATTSSITGSDSTGSVGTLSNSLTHSGTGNTASGAVNSVTHETLLSSTGNAVAGLIGNVVAVLAITIGLTGASMAGNVGSVTYNRTASIPGSAVTATVGSVTTLHSTSLATNAITATDGYVTATIENVAAASGNSVAGSPGDVAPVLSSSASISGDSASGSIGSVAPSNTKSLTGSAATATVGSVTTSQSISLASNELILAVGSVSTTGEALVTLSGNAADGFAGNVTPSLSSTVAITGNAAAAAGNVDYVVFSKTENLSGSAATATVGSVTTLHSTSLATNAITATDGSVAALSEVDVAITGHVANGYVGNSNLSVDSSLVGNDITSAVESFTIITELSENPSIIADIGNVTAASDITRSLSGNHALGYSDSLLAYHQSVDLHTNHVVGEIETIVAKLDKTISSDTTADGFVHAVYVSPSVNLTHNSASGFVGTISAAEQETVSLIGNQVTGDVESLLSLDVEVSLTGNNVLGEVNSFTVSGIVDVTGEHLSSTEGNLTAISVSMVTTAIDGHDLYSDTSNLENVELSIELTGNEVFVDVESLPAEIGYTLYGNAINTSVDNTTPVDRLFAVGNSALLDATYVEPYVTKGYVTKGYVLSTVEHEIELALSGVSATASSSNVVGLGSYPIRVQNLGIEMIEQNSAPHISVFMRAATDHMSYVAFATLAIKISKNGGPFTSVSRTVVETGEGWYSVQLLASDTNTAGDIIIKCSASECDDTDVIGQVSMSVNSMLAEMYKLHGLDAAAPLVVTKTSRTAGSGISQTISGDSNSTTVTRV